MDIGQYSMLPGLASNKYELPIDILTFLFSVLSLGSRKNRYSQTGERQDTRSRVDSLSLDAGLDDSQLKVSSHQKRAAESVSKLSEEKKHPCRARRTNPKCHVQVIVEENSVTIDVN